MNIKKVAVFGDSILKGIQLDSDTKRYKVNNLIDIKKIEDKHLISIDNFSMFGCTVNKGSSMLERRLSKRFFDVAVIEYGGNDCDFNWKNISERPDDHHTPNTPVKVFIETYKKMIYSLKEKNIKTIIATLPPLEPQRFFDWFCKDLNKENVLKWLGSVNTIYRFQEMYSRIIERIARETNTLLIDIRSAFLNHFSLGELLCEDGIHPNSNGHGVITEAILNFSV